MRIRSLFFCLSALASLAACSKTDAPVRLDFVGATGLLSGNRTVEAGDTLVTHAYAVGNDQPLKRLRIEVTYEPGLAPILYPIPTSSFDTTRAPRSLRVVYLDSLLPAGSGGAGRGSEILFVNGLMARTTSGKETWTYTATDASDQTAARAYRLTVRKTDSAAVFHNYPLILRPIPFKAPRPASVRDSRRVFLNLRSGLLLPKYAVLNNSASLLANQTLVDLVCVANRAGTAVSLAAPADTASRVPLNGSKWPADADHRRATEVRAVGLTPTQFANAATNAGILAVFNAGAAYKYPNGLTSNKTTGPLALNQVIAFKAFDSNGVAYYGLLQVTAFTGGTNPLLTCQVKVQKY
ncbi:hypothetical protein MON38_14290 [Hymenobacter sp. DH14]|uniref:DUF5018 domain-containing protein n=1 Tax=Hymenobacter cyanobacteriorum TaxID=2926463 RepID=A0A9X1VHA6_9BACT|nr:hypothetical protein [Hymenobacter cyanobacteriorum]MCI1188595.1 hypothetical protein [Hymenobacter cyanobacteriorum]